MKNPSPQIRILVTILKTLFLPICPVPDFELGQLDSQVHDGNCNDFRLPLKAQSGAQTVVDESPGHLHHFLQLLLVT